MQGMPRIMMVLEHTNKSCLKMVKVKRALTTVRKEEKMTSFYEMKLMEEENWKAKMTTEDRKVLLEGETN